jgi:hypothetical protein
MPVDATTFTISIVSRGSTIPSSFPAVHESLSGEPEEQKEDKTLNKAFSKFLSIRTSCSFGFL